MNNNEESPRSILEQWGWTSFFQSRLDASLEREAQTTRQRSRPVLGRVIGQERDLYSVVDENGIELRAELRGRWRRATHQTEDLPAVGDWVTLAPRYGEGRASIEDRIERRTCLRRKAVGALGAQVIAANVDVAFIVSSLNDDWSARRLERYLTAIRETGAQPVVLLTKADLVDEPSQAVLEAERSSGSTPVFAISATSGWGLERLEPLLKPGSTFVLIGSSGVGKSTLVNRLFGRDIAATSEIRESDSKGRHTTTSRHLFKLPNGALMIDTPGMREFGLWDATQGLDETFSDVEEFARRCRFTDCRHEGEPGCAVAAAVEAGELDSDRVAHHERLERELAHQARKRDKELARQQREHWKKITLQQRARNKAKGRFD